MESGQDIMWRTGIAFASAAAAFAAAVVVFRRNRAFPARDVLLSGALFWSVFAADVSGLVATLAFGAAPSAVYAPFLVVYPAAAVAGLAAYRRGRRTAVAAAAAAVAGRLLLYLFFSWTYNAAIG